MTDPLTSYQHRDALRAADHDAIQTMLGILRDVLAAHNAGRQASERARERFDKKLDRIEEDLRQLRAHNAAQDRVASHTSAVAEEALTLAEHPTLRTAVQTASKTSGAWWGAASGGAVVGFFQFLQFLIERYFA